MRSSNLLICIAVLAFIIAPALSEDFLNPSATGESMSMPLPLDLVQEAVDAGIIKGTNSEGDIMPLGSQGAAVQDTNQNPLMDDSGPDATDPLDSSTQTQEEAQEQVNVAGNWSLVLNGGRPRLLEMALIQSDNAVSGYGSLKENDSTKSVAAGGSISSGRLNLFVTPAGEPLVYRLDLSPSGTSMIGSYSANITGGSAEGGQAGSGALVGTVAGARLDDDASAPPSSTSEPTSSVMDSSAINTTASNQVPDLSESGTDPTTNPADDVKSGSDNISSDKISLESDVNAASDSVAKTGATSQAGSSSSSTGLTSSGSSFSSSNSFSGSGSNSQEIQMGSGSAGSYSSMTSTSSASYG